MKVSYKGAEFTIESERDLELFTKVMELLEGRKVEEVKVIKRRVGRVRSVEAYLRKNRDHPELREFAEFLRKKGLSDSTVYHYVAMIHKHVIHGKGGEGLKPQSKSPLYNARRYWFIFQKVRGKKEGLQKFMKKS